MFKRLMITAILGLGLTGCFEAKDPDQSVDSNGSESKATGIQATQTFYSESEREDAPSNSHEVFLETIAIMESEPPTTTSSLLDSRLNVSPPINLSCQDATGCSWIHYSITLNGQDLESKSVEGGETQIQLPQSNGVYRVEFAGEDVWGNREPSKSLQITIDQSSPVLGITPTESEFFSAKSFGISCTAGEGDSCTNLAVRVNGQSMALAGPSITLSQSGVHTIEAIAQDSVGNQSILTVQKTIRLACSSPSISATGFWPCERQCGSGYGEEAQSVDGKACACLPGRIWSDSQAACVINPVVLLLIGGQQ